jgi:hypothetical protein
MRRRAAFFRGDRLNVRENDRRRAEMIFVLIIRLCAHTHNWESLKLKGRASYFLLAPPGDLRSEVNRGQMSNFATLYVTFKRCQNVEIIQSLLIFYLARQENKILRPKSIL